MKWIALLLAVAVVVFAASRLLVTPPAPNGPGEIYRFEDPGALPGGPVVAPPAAAPSTPPKPRQDPATRAPAYAPDAAIRRPPGARPAGGAGEIVRADLPKEEAERVEATRLKLSEAMLEDVDWRHRALRKALDQVAEKAGVPVEIEGEGLDDEPVLLRSAGENALEILRRVATDRNLRFEVLPGKVVVRR